MAVAGLRGTTDFGPDERPKNFREMILFRNPTGSAPIFALTSKARKKTVDDSEFKWWDEPNTNVILNNAAALAAGDTTIVVDSTDPTSTDAGKEYGVATHLKPGDVLQAEKTETATYDNELIEVVNVVSDTTFTARRGVAGSTAGTIAQDADFTLMGSAYAEGTAAPKAVARNPIQYENYTQIHKDTYEITGTVNETNLRTGNAWSNDKRRKTFDHSRGIEWAILFGRKHVGTGDNGKPKRYAGGLREFIPASNTKIFTAAMTINELLDHWHVVFDWDTGAGDSRMAFCGNLALNNFNKVVQSDANTDINFEGATKMFGMTWMEFRMPQGTIFLKTHPLMNRHPQYNKSMFTLDFDSLRYVPLRNRDTKAKDDVQTDDEDVRRGFYQTECSIQVDRGGLTMAYTGNMIAA